MGTFDCLQPMVFGAYNLFIKTVLLVFTSKQFAAVLILFGQITSPEPLDLGYLFIKVFNILLKLCQVVD